MSVLTGLGELTFLQMSTTYAPPSVAGHSLGYVSAPTHPSEGIHAGQHRYFASGTGAAGLVGAFMWWEVRSLGVRTGVGLSSVNIPFHPVKYQIYMSPSMPADSAVDNPNHLFLPSPTPKRIHVLFAGHELRGRLRRDLTHAILHAYSYHGCLRRGW